MKTTTTLTIWALLSAGLVLHTHADQAIAMPEGLPPVIGTASVGGPGKIGTIKVDWRINLTVPQVNWEVIDNQVLNDEIRTRVVPVKTELRMGGPSALGPSVVVDLKGKELTREEVFARLKNETPVLVSVSGRLPEPYYLQQCREDSLIILLRTRDRYTDQEMWRKHNYLLPTGLSGVPSGGGREGP